MFNFFKKKGQQKNILDLDFEFIHEIFVNIQNYGSLEIKVKGQMHRVSTYWYSLPFSYQNNTSLKIIQERGFNNLYEVLNSIYKKANILPCDVEAEIANENEFDIFCVKFFTPPNDIEKLHSKAIQACFYFLFVIEGKASEINDYRLLFTRKNDFEILQLLDAKFVGDKQKLSEEEQNLLEQLERNLIGVAQSIHLDIPKKYEEKYQNLLPGEPTVADFERAIERINYIKFDGDALKTAQTAHKKFVKTAKKDEENGLYFSARYALMNEENLWGSDWKFDPEDMYFMVEGLVGGEWDFDFPEETYSHNLFPFMKNEFDQKELALMNFNTGGDSYDFFIVEKQYVNEILELSWLLNLGIEQIL